MSKYSANFSLLPHQFPLSFPLEQPLDGGLRRARLTLQEGAAALHPKLHRFSQTLLYCTERDKRNGDSWKTKPFNFKCAKHKKVAWPLALKPLHCLSGSPCLTSCLLLLLRKRSELRIKCTSSLVWRCWEDKRPLWPLCGRGEGGAALSIPGAVGVSSQTAVGAGPAVHAAAVQRHLGQPRVWWHVQLLLWWRKQNKVSSVWLWGICCASDLCLRWICLLF